MVWDVLEEELIEIANNMDVAYEGRGGSKMTPGVLAWKTGRWYCHLIRWRRPEDSRPGERRVSSAEKWEKSWVQFGKLSEKYY